MRKLVPFAFVLALVPLAAHCDGDSSPEPGETGGAGGTGGNDGQGGDTPGGDNLALPVRAAVLFGSCVPDNGIDSWLNRFYTHRGGSALDVQLLERLDCLEGKANGCQALDECFGLAVDLEGPCSASCTGEVYTSCDDRLRFNLDCAKLGMACSEEAGGCEVDPAPPACNPATFMASCVDGAPTVCFDVERTGQRCAELGLICGTIAGGEPGCIGTGAACQADTIGPLSVQFDEGIACDGNTLKACVNGYEHNLDCGSLQDGFTCQSGGSGTFCGLDAACEPGEKVAGGCDGDSVLICNAGRVDRIDCKALGFSTCDAQFGLCVPSVYTSQP
ncbi:hypothetical protein [Chondromyces crocatus]|uniref:SRCR domain-containing protein n=1 Tax=Chondromyces crocatus TaxID=52 RepID=A0A0K1EPJ9_CHOCO|nr:hypothetical protein [Chondromyces crocatus]AKT42562.1 uncharacterized protein CMC5_067890 [Chondromyces crocatus]